MMSHESLEAQHERIRREIRSMSRRCAVTAGMGVILAAAVIAVMWKLHTGG